ncbi:hypothetical protein Pmani_037185 [Petrolisthes manimaculis]|uniref:Uncharacterized protein n=1 Tax=Petrolisthes manimaculis TaxID=1843537 RepID=A0AAE1NIY4_9EUCA|nr:hypothetical protein Pmani_037718 [Petrolisthes manimaculis]KAK4289874.1 hypothetical protein Pmani_037185 [Petrolisthes manimaculis]
MPGVSCPVADLQMFPGPGAGPGGGRAALGNPALPDLNFCPAPSPGRLTTNATYPHQLPVSTTPPTTHHRPHPPPHTSGPGGRQAASGRLRVGLPGQPRPGT